jgi:hypothetical protein
MNAYRLLLSFVLWFIPFAISAQRTISGRVTDADDSTPIPGVAVFIANTTVGTTTDADGKYSIQIPGEGSYRLTVSHVAYQPVFRDIEPGKTPVVFDVALKTHEMEEVTVSAKANYRKKDVDLFWRTILGKKPSKKTIYATNPDDVYYFYNNKTQKLTVSCRVPLKIVNNETGYQIKYVLNHFTHDYNADVSAWEGQCLFDELEPGNFRQKNTWNKNRQKIYNVSIANFIRSLYHHSLHENGFLLLNIRKEEVKAEVVNKRKYDNVMSTISYYRNKYDLIQSDVFLNNPITGYKSFHIPSDMEIMLISFGRPVTNKDLQDIESPRNR